MVWEAYHKGVALGVPGITPLISLGTWFQIFRSWVDYTLILLDFKSKGKPAFAGKNPEENRLGGLYDALEAKETRIGILKCILLDFWFGYWVLFLFIKCYLKTTKVTLVTGSFNADENSDLQNEPRLPGLSS